MVIEALVSALLLIATAPLAVLPTYTTPDWVDRFHIVTETPMNNVNALVPVADGLEFIGFCVVAGAVLLPVIAIVWLWGAIRP